MIRRLLAIPAAVLAIVLATAPAFAAAPFPARIDLPDGWQPEGITAGRGFTAYVGSLADGSIARVDLRTGVVDAEFVEGEGRMAVGIDYEAGADRLWVAGGDTGEVRVYDATTGAHLETYPVVAGFLNDVVVTRDAVYVTDSFIQQLIVIPLGSGGEVPDPADAFALPIVGDFVYGDGFNANGIVEFAGWLIVPQSGSGQLFAIDPSTGRSVEILPEGSVVSADGLELLGSTLYVVRNFANEIDILRITGGTVRQLGTITQADVAAELDIPTTIAFAGGRLWAVNARFETAPSDTTEYWITQVPLR